MKAILIAKLSDTTICLQIKKTILYTIRSLYVIIWINGMDKLLLTPEQEKPQYFQIRLRK